MVAISPQTERQNDFMVTQHLLPFPILSDPDCALAAQFGLAYTVPQYLRDYYLSILVNLPFINGDSSWRLPLPATCVISPAGRILYAEAHADFRVRPEPEEALAAAFASPDNQHPRPNGPAYAAWRQHSLPWRQGRMLSRRPRRFLKSCTIPLPP